MVVDSFLMSKSRSTEQFPQWGLSDAMHGPYFFTTLVSQIMSWSARFSSSKAAMI